MVRDASSLWIYNDSCARITTLPRGTFVDFTGTRQANKCVAGGDMVKIRWGSGYAWAAASVTSGGTTTNYLAYCPGSSNPFPFGTPSQSYRGMSAPFAPTTAKRWPLAQPFMSRPAVCYMNTAGQIYGPGNSPPSCGGAATEFAAYRCLGGCCLALSVLLCPCVQLLIFHDPKRWSIHSAQVQQHQVPQRH